MVCLPEPSHDRSRIDSNPQDDPAPSPGDVQQPLRAAPSPSAGGCVLIVEDHAGTRNALERVLRRCGYDPVSFGSATGAVEWLSEHCLPSAEPGQDGGTQHERQIPAAILVDIHLPDGDGLALTRRLRRELGEAVPIVVVSGDTSIETLSRLRDAGADRFVGKPVTPAALEAAILDASAREQSARPDTTS